MREYFVTENNEPKKWQKMREYSIPENIEKVLAGKSGKKCVSIYCHKISAKESGKKCVSISYQKFFYDRKRWQKMREYFVPENIGQKSLYEMRTHFLSVQISAKSGIKCVSIFYQP